MRTKRMRTGTTITWGAAGLALLATGGTMTERVFQRVGYPGSSFGGVPLTFDLERKRNNLASMDSRGTLGLFGDVQLLDFSIVVGTLVVFTTLTLLAIRAQGGPDRLRRVGRWTLVAFLVAPAMDALENISARVIVGLWPRYPEWLDLLNSTFTLGKVAGFVVGWCGLAALLGSAMVRWLRRP